MEFKLPDLPYQKSALVPHISEETLEYHYGKHHATYVAKLNAIVADSPFAKASLETIVKEAPQGGVFNNAAQVWNHTFYWSCLSPKGGGEPTGEVLKMLEQKFGSVQNFVTQFTESAINNFGSGWTWLAKDKSGEISIVNTSNAENPLRNCLQPVLTCDVWEHAYYIDYRNARPSYMEAFWNLINWDFVNANLDS